MQIPLLHNNSYDCGWDLHPTCTLVCDACVCMFTCGFPHVNGFACIRPRECPCLYVYVYVYVYVYAYVYVYCTYLHMYTVPCTLYIVIIHLLCVHCTYILCITVYTGVQCAYVHCTLYRVYCTVYSVVYIDVLYTVYTSVD